MTLRLTEQEYAQLQRRAGTAVASAPSPWGKAKPPRVDGIVFRSKTEARVYARLKSELLPEQKLVIDCRFPLVALSPRIGRASKAGYITIDFCIFATSLGCWRLVRAVDAKPMSKAARSRDWSRGARAFAATYGADIICVEK